MQQLESEILQIKSDNAQLEFPFNANAANRQRLSNLIALLREYGELA